MAARLQLKDLAPAPVLSPSIPAYAVPPGSAGKPYRDPWDVFRAVDGGLLRSTWVYRAINAISGNAAKLPMVMRAGNPIDGKEVDHPMLDRFNFTSSPYENALLFRKRMSQVLLLNRQGVMIELIMSRFGDLVALYILPPGYTWPIPDEQTFVSGYRVQFPGRGWYDVPAENVIWIREPHPTEPYGGLTPLEAAGLSVETDYYQHLYRRNYLMNDARPGGILLIKGEIDDTVGAELKRRFSGPMGWGAGGAGRLTVMEAEDGQYLDTSSTPRDAEYVEGGKLAKEEILEAFGVPESVIGNASGRTFDNADAELEVFWRETMLPHLETLARGLDVLDPDPRMFLGYDLSRVHVLQRDMQNKRTFALSEVAAGTISRDEYRIERGLEPLGGGAAKLYIPMTLVEIGDTTLVMANGMDPPTFHPSQEQTAAQPRMLELKSADHSDGVMLACYPPSAVAAQLAALVPDGEDADDLHVTLCYLGKSADWPEAKLARLETLMAGFVADEAPVIAEITGTGQFTVTPGSDGQIPEIALVSSAPLVALRQRLMDRLDAVGLAPAA